MLHVEGCSIMCQADDIKAAGFTPGVMTAQPDLRSLADLCLLGRGQGIGRAARPACRPCLDFHKDQHGTVAANQIQFQAAVTPVAFQNAPAPALQKAGSNFFTDPAQFGRREPGLFRQISVTVR